MLKVCLFKTICVCNNSASTERLCDSVTASMVKHCHKDAGEIVETDSSSSVLCISDPHPRPTTS